MAWKPGWYPDPQRQAAFRWWDGAFWTVHVRNGPKPQSPRVVASHAWAERAPEKAQAEPIPSVPTLPGASPGSVGPNELNQLRAEYESLLAQVVELREIAMLQEAGVYRYHHPLDTAAAFKERLEQTRASIAGAVKAGSAVRGARTWAVNGDLKEGAKMVADLSKLMLRAYNNEADNAVRTMKPYALASAIKKLDQSRATILKLGRVMQIEVTDAYHQLRVAELELVADFLSKQADEREAERAERARLKEEEKAQRELAEKRAKLEKEQAHYQTAILALQAKGDTKAVADAEAKLQQIQAAIAGVIERAANVRAGYVYVISNVGSFGTEVVKIGMTRRLEPLDRVRELGDASVPFRFDTHAIVFSDDAVGLETKLHQEFAARRVNAVNLHREYFFATPNEVRDALTKHTANLLSFVEEPEAYEWRQSLATRATPSAAATDWDDPSDGD